MHDNRYSLLFRQIVTQRQQQAAEHSRVNSKEPAFKPSHRHTCVLVARTKYSYMLLARTKHPRFFFFGVPELYRKYRCATCGSSYMPLLRFFVLVHVDRAERRISSSQPVALGWVHLILYDKRGKNRCVCSTYSSPESLGRKSVASQSLDRAAPAGRSATPQILSIGCPSMPPRAIDTHGEEHAANLHSSMPFIPSKGQISGEEDATVFLASNEDFSNYEYEASSIRRRRQSQDNHKTKPSRPPDPQIKRDG